MATAGLVTVASLMMAVIVAVGTASVKDDGGGSAVPEPLLAGAGERPEPVTPSGAPATLDASPLPTTEPPPAAVPAPADTGAPEPTRTQPPPPPTEASPSPKPSRTSDPLYPTGEPSPTEWPQPWPTEGGEEPWPWPTDDQGYIEVPWWYWCWIQPWGAHCS